MINNNVWKILEEENKNFPEEKCDNATDQDIGLAEQDLGLSFSDGYKYFLKNHQCNSIGELNFYPIPKNNVPTNNYTVVQATKRFKNQENWPDIEDWYVVSNNGSGDPIGIKPNGEVWISYHDSGFEQEKLADDFEEFVYKLLTETLWG